MQALQLCHHKTVLKALFILREFFDVAETLAIKQVKFYAHASLPTQWFTDHV